MYERLYILHSDDPVLLNTQPFSYFSAHISTLCCLSQSESPVSHACIQSLLLKFSAQELIEVRQPTIISSSSSSTLVISVDHTKLWAMIGSSTTQPPRTGVKRKGDDAIHQTRAPGSSPLLQSPPSPPKTSSISLASSSNSQPGASDWKLGGGGAGPEKKGRTNKGKTSHLDMEIESLLSQQSTKEQQSKKVKSIIKATPGLISIFQEQFFYA